MTNDVTLACQCGAFHAVIHDASPATGNHAFCYCTDCQAAARHLNPARSIMDNAGGTEVYQTQPYQVEITSGLDKLAVLQLAKKGLYRWHTTCCNTPICNTMGTPKVSFMGFMVENMTAGQDALGPILLKYKTEQATASVPLPHGSVAKLVLRSVRNILRSRLNGRWKQNPLFGEDGRPLVKPYVLSEAERVAAYGH